MKVYEFGADTAPVILLLPGTCCHWKSNFGQVIPLLQRDFRVLCVSYDGFDETESTEFPTMLAETEKIEAYILKNGPPTAALWAALSWDCWPVTLTNGRSLSKASFNRGYKVPVFLCIYHKRRRLH